MSVPFQISWAIATRASAVARATAAVSRSCPHTASARGGEMGRVLSDLVCVPYAEHMLVPGARQVSSLRRSRARRTTSATPGAQSGRRWPRSPAPRCSSSAVPSSGSIGLYAAALALALGAESVLYVDGDAARRQTAAALGAETLAECAQASRPVPDHRGLERRPRRSRPRVALDRARRDLHQHRYLLRRAALASAAGDVHEGHHLQDRSCPRARGDPTRARAGRGRRNPPRADHHPRGGHGTTPPRRCSSATGRS